MKRILSDEDLKSKILEIGLQLIEEGKIAGPKKIRSLIRGSEQRIIKFLDELIEEGKLPSRKKLQEKIIIDHNIRINLVKKKKYTLAQRCIKQYGRKRLLREYRKNGTTGDIHN